MSSYISPRHPNGDSEAGPGEWHCQLASATIVEQQPKTHSPTDQVADLGRRRRQQQRLQQKQLAVVDMYVQTTITR